MSWSSGRRLIIAAIVFVVVTLLIGWVVYGFVHRAPSCVDGKQNQNEEGVDCGGGCPYLCTAKIIPPVVSFARELSQGNRTDVIAYIKNPNTSAAAKNVKYTIELYNNNRAVIAKKDGTATLAPGIDTVIFVPNFFSGTENIDRVFLSLDTDSALWFPYKKALAIPTVEEAKISGTEAAPRITARVNNPFATPLRSVKLIATVFDEEGNAIAASQTVIPEIRGQGTAEAIFTWNTPFTASVSRIDVKPVATITTP